MPINLLRQPLNRVFKNRTARRRSGATAAASDFAFLGLFSTQTAKADQLFAATTCMRLGYVEIQPIFMGQTVSGYEQWACADSSGFNLKRPPFPIVICGSFGTCRHVGWTY